MANAEARSEQTRRLVLLTEGFTEPIAGKTAASVIRYCRSEVVAVLDRTCRGQSVATLLGVGDEDLPIIGDLAEAPDATGLLIGIAPPGGRIPVSWRPIILAAIDRGMEITSGLHQFLTDDSEFAEAARRRGVRLHDVRKNQERDVTQRQGLREDCLRIHTVGNDCSIGKMVASLEVAQGLRRHGHDAQFVATGQTGIMIAGSGCPIDCVVADFVNGAAEKLVLANQHHDILLIEGQGSLSHPRYSAVTLGLLHGSMPHGLILCYEAGRTHVNGMPAISLVALQHLRTVYEMMANLQNPCRVIGIAINTRRLSDREADLERDRVRAEMNLPACDVFRHGAEELVHAVIDLREELFG